METVVFTLVGLLVAGFLADIAFLGATALVGAAGSLRAGK